MKISSVHVGQCFSEKRAGAIVLGSMVKVAYENSVIYNYSPHRHSQIFGISPMLMQKCVSWLVNNNLATISDRGHLRIRSFSDKKIGYNIPIPKHVLRGKSYYECLSYFRVAFMKKHGHTQAYRARQKRRQQSLAATSSAKMSRESQPVCHVTWTAESLSSLLGMSRSCVFGLLKYAEKQKWLKRKRRHEISSQPHSKQSFAYIKKHVKTNAFQLDSGYVIFPNANSYTFSNKKMYGGPSIRFLFAPKKDMWETRRAGPK